MASQAETRLHLILLAGGKGLRASSLAGGPPKQFRETARGPLYLVCLQEFLKLQRDPNTPMASLTITVPDSWRQDVVGHLKELENSSEALALTVPWLLASAGETRTQSTWSAISALAAGDNPPCATDLVAVHDAARPFASSALLARLSTAAIQHKAAVPGIPVPDSLVQITHPNPETSQTGNYVDRSTIFSVQTPQVFQWDVFMDAHRWAAENAESFTDDGSLLAHKGTMPQVVEGETENWKVTTPVDIDRAVDLLEKSSP